MKGILLFDIDGVIRDVTGSYRLAIQKTVEHFTGWEPSLQTIDKLKEEGNWNNDWQASLELVKRHQEQKLEPPENSPDYENLIKVFSNFYFGGDPNGDPNNWTGFIKNEPLLVNNDLFNQLSFSDIKWGFVSGAEKSSARFVLKDRLGLKHCPLIAMGDAPEKPNPEGLIQIAEKISGNKLGKGNPPIAYVGDTIADILTIKNAEKLIPSQRFISIAIAPPHLQGESKYNYRIKYESILRRSGADIILIDIKNIMTEFKKYL